MYAWPVAARSDHERNGDLSELGVRVTFEAGSPCGWMVLAGSDVEDTATGRMCGRDRCGRDVLRTEHSCSRPSRRLRRIDRSTYRCTAHRGTHRPLDLSSVHAKFGLQRTTNMSVDPSVFPRRYLCCIAYHRARPSRAINEDSKKEKRTTSAQRAKK